MLRSDLTLCVQESNKSLFSQLYNFPLHCNYNYVPCAHMGMGLYVCCSGKPPAGIKNSIWPIVAYNVAFISCWQQMCRFDINNHFVFVSELLYDIFMLKLPGTADHHVANAFDVYGSAVDGGLGEGEFISSALGNTTYRECHNEPHKSDQSLPGAFGFVRFTSRGHSSDTRPTVWLLFETPWLFPTSMWFSLCPPLCRAHANVEMFESNWKFQYV